MRGRHTFIGAIAAVGLLAGACTAGGTASTPSSINPSASHAPVTLTMWSGFSNPEFGYLKKTIEGFTQKYPWITVNSVPSKKDTDVLNAIHSGTAPDVAAISVPDDTVQFCSTNGMIDLAPYFKADHIDLPKLIPAGALAYTSYAYKPSQCMLPMLTDAYGLYYNTDMFAKAGITGPPKSYTELLADAKKLTQYNPDGSIKVAGFLPLATGDYELANYVNGNSIGAQWYDSSGKCALGSDPRFAQMLTAIKGITDALGYDKLNRFFASNGGENTEFSPSNLFENRKIAMVIDGEWRVGFIAHDKSTVPYATAPFPVADSTPQLYGSGQIGGTTIGIPRGTQHAAEAWLLVKYLSLDPAGEQSLAEQLRNIPTVVSVLNDPVLAQDPHFATFLKIFPNPNSHYKQITKLGFGDVSLYDPFVDKYLSGKVPDLHAGLEALAAQIDKQLQLGG